MIDVIVAVLFVISSSYYCLSFLWLDLSQLPNHATSKVLGKHWDQTTAFPRNPINDEGNPTPTGHQAQHTLCSLNALLPFCVLGLVVCCGLCFWIMFFVLYCLNSYLLWPFIVLNYLLWSSFKTFTCWVMFSRQQFWFHLLGFRSGAVPCPLHVTKSTIKAYSCSENDMLSSYQGIYPPFFACGPILVFHPLDQYMHYHLHW
jgi:hypothetical protein